jgi:DNA-directed RNA polymerase subunit M/transcription elongation factor TFIIS
MSISVFRFCKECGNTLKIFDTRGKLVYACRECNYKEKPRTTKDLLICYRPNQKKVSETPFMYKDFTLDSTYSIYNRKCPLCAYGQCIRFFSTPQNLEKIIYTHVCARREGKKTCGYSWEE